MKKLKAMTKKELYVLAQEKNISNRSKMDKSELLKALKPTQLEMAKIFIQSKKQGKGMKPLKLNLQFFAENESTDINTIKKLSDNDISWFHSDFTDIEIRNIYNGVQATSQTLEDIENENEYSTIFMDVNFLSVLEYVTEFSYKQINERLGYYGDWNFYYSVPSNCFILEMQG